MWSIKPQNDGLQKAEIPQGIQGEGETSEKTNLCGWNLFSGPKALCSLQSARPGCNAKKHMKNTGFIFVLHLEQDLLPTNSCC